MTPRVLNLRDTAGVLPAGALLVDRRTKWGNPFRMRRESERLDVIGKYEKHLIRTYDLLFSLGELRGKDLACWCAPSPCHADHLLRLANGVEFWAPPPGFARLGGVTLPEGSFLVGVPRLAEGGIVTRPGRFITGEADDPRRPDGPHPDRDLDLHLQNCEECGRTGAFCPKARELVGHSVGMRAFFDGLG